MISGVLNVYKDEGMTSHDVVAIIRSILRQKRIGHSGTLDPMATGVLPICLGKATKIADYISEQGKTYLGEMEFGLASDSLDRTGNIVERSDNKFFTNNEIDEAMDRFRGVIWQKPPMYSAVKVGGKKLYELARKGCEIDRPEKKLEIERLDILKLEGERLTFICTCSKGTYIRQLAYDLAKSLGSCAMLTNLERIRVGPFTSKEAYKIDDIRKLSSDQIESILWDMGRAIPHLERLTVNFDEGTSLMHGAFLDMKEGFEPNNPIFKIYMEDCFLGLGYIKDKKIRIKRMLFEG